MKTAIILHQQSLLDIALQHTGDPGNCFAIALANQMSVSEILEAGSQIVIPDTVTVNKDMLQYYTNKNIEPATAYHYTAPSGIGVMVVGDSFMVG